MKAIPGPSGGGDLKAFHTRCILNRGKHANVACWQIVLQNSKNGFQRFFREKSNQAIIADR